MKNILTTFAAIIGAVLGFMAGLLVAVMLGLHEKPHVFGLALPCAALAAWGTVALLSYLHRARWVEQSGGRSFLLLASGVVALGCVVLLLSIVM